MSAGGLHRRGDTRAATWKRVVARLRRDAARLREFGYQVVEPDELDVHPDGRDAKR